MNTVQGTNQWQNINSNDTNCCKVLAQKAIIVMVEAPIVICKGHFS